MPTVVNDFCLDMHHNYRHNQDFASTYREAYAMLTSANSLQEALPSNDRDVIKQHLVSIDQLKMLRCSAAIWMAGPTAGSACLQSGSGPDNFFC